MSDIKCFRLKTGEPIIAKVIDNTNGWTIKEPALIMQVDLNGRIGLMPWMPYCETDNITLPDDIIQLILDPIPAISKEYTKATSKLVVPDNEITTAGANLKLISE